jgi:hypothetical protein
VVGLVCYPSVWTEGRKDSRSETSEAIIEEVAIGLVHAKPRNNPHHSLGTHDLISSRNATARQPIIGKPIGAKAEVYRMPRLWEVLSVQTRQPHGGQLFILWRKTVEIVEYIPPSRVQ